jgi:hypothetical protein
VLLLQLRLLGAPTGVLPPPQSAEEGLTQTRDKEPAQMQQQQQQQQQEVVLAPCDATPWMLCTACSADQTMAS